MYILYNCLFQTRGPYKNNIEINGTMCTVDND